MTASVDNVQRQDVLCATNEDLDILFLLDDPSVTGYTGFLSIYKDWASKVAGEDPVFALTPSAGMTTNDTEKSIRARIAQADVVAGLDAAAITIEGSPHLGHFAPTKSCPYDLVIKDGAGNPARSLVGNVIFDLGLTAP